MANPLKNRLVTVNHCINEYCDLLNSQNRKEWMSHYG
nr:MAG TPA: hypothetical protein [Caudoviricetes sp.]DAY74524.1 MAG TPA: hypothetical protein [Caudoviricetes sp.]